MFGFALLSYPFISNYIFEKSAGSTIKSYEKQVKTYDQKQKEKAFEEAKEAKAFLTVEMNILGQMVDDVKLATEGKYPVDHYGSIFEIPETDGIIAKAKEMLKKGEI